MRAFALAVPRRFLFSFVLGFFCIFIAPLPSLPPIRVRLRPSTIVIIHFPYAGHLAMDREWLKNSTQK